MSYISLVMNKMGDDSLISKERSDLVERINCIKAALFSTTICESSHDDWWKIMKKVCIGWSPSLENHNLLSVLLHPKSIF